jgi:hypothetical protein
MKFLGYLFDYISKAFAKDGVLRFCLVQKQTPLAAGFVHD